MKLDKIKEWEAKIEKHKKKRTKYRELANNESLAMKRLFNHITTYKKRNCQDNNR